MNIHFKVNGTRVEIEVDPDEMLLEVLRRDLDLRSVRATCSVGVCGACTALIDGEPISTCIYLAPLADGCEITTVEGLGSDHPVQRAFEEEHAFQCGYCTPGMILTVKTLLEENPHPSDEEIKVALGGNLCRCGCYVKIINAVKRAAARDVRKSKEEDLVTMTRIVDLSPRVPHGFMGPPSTNIGVQFEVRTKRSGSSYWQSGQVFMSLHTGCHVESALHCFDDGESIDQVSLERVIGSSVILDLTPVAERALIDVQDLERARERLAAQHETIKAGDILLLRTDWAQRAIGTPIYFPQSPGLTEAAARWLVEKQPKCIGCDFFEEPAAREPGWTADQFVVHRVILGANIPLVEGLVNLAQLPPRCQFFAPFYHFAGIDSAPARAFALVEE